MFKWLASALTGVAVAALDAIQAYATNVPQDFSTLDGLLTFVVVSLIARGAGWLIARIPVQEG